MIKKAFFGWSSPVLEYDPSSTPMPAVTQIDPPAQVVIFADGSYERQSELVLGPGASVHAGEMLKPFSERDTQVISPIDGTVAGLTPVVNATGQKKIAIRIEAGSSTLSSSAVGNIQTADREAARTTLPLLPGTPPLNLLTQSDPPIHHIVINGADPDVMVLTNRYVLQNALDEIVAGIEYLKKTFGIQQATIIAPSEMIQSHGHIGAEVANVSKQYPSAFPKMILNDVFQQTVAERETVEKYGYLFCSAEAAAAIGTAVETGRIPMEKLITVIENSGRRHLVNAVVGTPISDIFEALNIRVEEKDRIVSGGPMTGVSIYDEHHPVEPGMDALMVQSAIDISRVSDYPCINCGECVRACPVHIPVNMLVRFLEFGDYVTAADEYNLDACIECGLCSYVCVSRIPIFQYIMLAKTELAKEEAAEAVDEQ